MLREKVIHTAFMKIMQHVLSYWINRFSSLLVLVLLLTVSMFPMSQSLNIFKAC